MFIQFLKKISLFSLFFFISCTHSLPDFTSRLSSRLPTTLPTESIGEYSLGCLSGAQTFNGDEPGLILSQIKRGRYWGHPELINLLKMAGKEFSKNNKKIIIGDLSLSRGGPMLTGHNSHQIGLDVDIWFKVINANQDMNFRERETLEMNSFSELNEDQKNLIRYFANSDKVERIFINPKFKQSLCQDHSPLSLSSEAQHKLRAWWGHDDHIHVRLKCPADSKKCKSQNPIPEGTGCGEELNWWFGEEARSQDKDSTWEELKSIYLNKVEKLPFECSFYKEFN